MLDPPRRAGPEADKRGPRASGPPRPGQGKAGLDRGLGAATASRGASCGARARAATATASGGARRHGEVKPERGRGGVHGVEGMAASLTSDGTGEERRRTGGAAALGGGGR